MKSFGWIVMSSLVVFLMMTSTSWAQGGPPRTCDEDSIGGCVGEILDEQDATITAVEELLNVMEPMLGGIRAANVFSFSPQQFGLTAGENGPDLGDLRARIQTLKDSNRRAKDTNDVTSDDEYDGFVSQGDMDQGKKKCTFSDMPFFNSLKIDPDDPNEDPDLALIDLQSANPKFGNGRCDIFSAVDLAGIPVRVNERRENMCERVCKEKTGQKGKSKGRFVDGLRDTLSSTRRARNAISAQTATVRHMGSVLSNLQLSKADFLLSPAHSDPCALGEAPGPGPDLIAVAALDVIITASDVVLVVVDIVVKSLQAITNVSEVGCAQDVAGFNARSACLPFTLAFGITDALASILKGARLLLVDARAIVKTAAAFGDSFKRDMANACSKTIKDDFEGGQCVSGMCHGGPDDNKVCANDSDCSDGAIVILQGDVDKLKVAVDILKVAAGKTDDDLTAIKAELVRVMSLLEATRDLLLTPAGRREGFQP